jgi:choline/glycine/proline betaine transport protein
MQTITDDISLLLHTLLGELPLTSITSVAGTLLITIFFITSSDSGSFVDDMVTSGGDPNPPTAQRVFWAFSEGAVAITLLIAGGLQALRTASLISGLPMAFILLFSAYGIIKSLNIDHQHPDVPHVRKLYQDRNPLTGTESSDKGRNQQKENAEEHK